MKRLLLRAAFAVVVCVLAVSSTASARSRYWMDMRRGHPEGEFGVSAAVRQSLLWLRHFQWVSPSLHVVVPFTLTSQDVLVKSSRLTTQAGAELKGTRTR
jgi:hypothetical protein